MDSGGFPFDRPLKPTKSKARWYDLHHEQDAALIIPGPSFIRG